MNTPYRNLQNSYQELLRDALDRNKKITDDCYRKRIDDIYLQSKELLDLILSLIDQLTSIRNRRKD